ncbi:hypothetical protein FACS1894133_2410 [Clostridia bacterium]|nr:hypothetical protein FACS1894133_2410 [Clostridia bacterium]
MDIPWVPSAFEQRNGRILRQGNNFEKLGIEVGIYNYVTEGTFDAYMLSIVTTKQKFISQMLNGKTVSRSCEDMDEKVLTYAEMQAVASGDPRIKERIELETEVSQLRSLESRHNQECYRLQDLIKSGERELKRLEDILEKAKEDVTLAAKIPKGDSFSITIGGETFTERKLAGAALEKSIQRVLGDDKADEVKTVGEYGGFEIGVCKKSYFNGRSHHCEVSVRNKLAYTSEVEMFNPIGNIVRIENLAKSVVKRKAEIENNISQLSADVEEAKKRR